ncbi:MULTISPECIES: gamma-butyrobetaine hydroxylase-like domain-containing protein [Pandoraea]|uniref:Uncharacterized protein conserved in bacteria n=2 Tax=Pandoraea TaxID=93217 RepID=A0A378YUG8_9BURK|nr:MULTISPECIES: DUF971 domain-containing protein [Pandoraea]AHB07297.1 hypothetical protein U875_19735 [Pandoraea pnomenusa 3kgm]AHB76511.1 hypothetical protein X636_14450 [Pandoraea pnomenusa]AHN75164.1 hypothetical protein DA70_12420 [Pandoraea pnomenusa]AIU28252.1 hypothetical protein LV28_18280 [Pandoraea pnomenusa]ANC47301.1 hypothetical protein A6P55_15475 [Pandoraea pnomenusa]
MAGLEKDTPIPVSLTLHRTSKVLELGYEDGKHYRLPFEFLRVLSPSAEVRGHGPGQETLQTGKRDVELTGLEPIGNYAVRPVFSDGHDTGIYSWDYLYELCVRQDALWQEYLDKLAAAGVERDTPMPSPAAGGCHHH